MKGNESVSIWIVHGPHAASGSFTQDVHRQLQQQADAAGRTLELRECSNLRTFVGHVCAARNDDTEFVLLDPGELASQVREHPEAGLTDALDSLAAPYIEVHEACDAELEHEVGTHKAPLATVIINGNIGSGYRIGLGIALRQLGEAHRSEEGGTSPAPLIA